MYAMATFLIVAVISMLFTRLATGALIATGMPPSIAAFQARSAFTGAGFTTVESENVVNHPIRRKIVAMTMLVGNLGTPTLIVTVLLGLAGPGPGGTTDRLLFMVGVMAMVLLLLSLPPVTRWLVSSGGRYARGRLIPAVADEVVDLVELGDGFVVAELALQAAADAGPRSLRGLDLALPDLHVLGVRGRDSSGTTTFLGEAPEDVDLGAGDVLVVFGNRARMEELAASEAI
jgi:hypothetical protein